MLRIVSVAFGFVSLFFLLYTARLLVVTRGLQHVRVGGQGAYIGAVVFPVITLGCAWASVVSWRRATRRAAQPGAV